MSKGELRRKQTVVARRRRRIQRALVIAVTCLAGIGWLTVLMLT